ncbi:MAG: M28 family peptidase [Nitrospirae bacterium]|nr:M28 family peptidase [Nitrospirota bacterium]
MPTIRRKRPRPGNDPETVIPQLIAQVTESRLTDHLKRLIGVRHHASAPERLDASADYITAQFRAAGLAIRNHWFEAFGHQNRNVVASVRGRARRGFKRESLLILAAHYDTVCNSPGADDNASGVAVMLEAARVLGSIGVSAPLAFIGFAQEEQHCLGSTLYAIKAQRAGLRIEGMIALECVGYASERSGSQRGPKELPVAIPDVGNFLGLVGNPEAAEWVKRFENDAGRYVPDLPLIGLLVPDAGHGFPDTRRSDHSPFWDAGYPALMLTDTANFRNPWYHQPGDTLERLNLAFMMKVAKAVVAVLAGAVAGRKNGRL